MTRDFEAEFGALWSIYPKRPGNPRHDAMTEYVRLGKRGSLPPVEEMIRAVRSYADYCKREGMVGDRARFVAHTRTWLHQHRWADWLAPVDVQAVPEIEAPVFLRRFVDLVGPRVWASLFADCAISTDGERIVIYTKQAWMRDKIENEFGSKIRATTGKAVEVQAV